VTFNGWSKELAVAADFIARNLRRRVSWSWAEDCDRIFYRFILGKRWFFAWDFDVREFTEQPMIGTARLINYLNHEIELIEIWFENNPRNIVWC
jgi:hypothetical protein